MYNSQFNPLAPSYPPVASRSSDDSISIYVWRWALWCLVNRLATALTMISVLWGLKLDAALLSKISIIPIICISRILLVLHWRAVRWRRSTSIIRLVVVVGLLMVAPFAGSPSCTISRRQALTAATAGVDTSIRSVLAR